MVKYIHSKSRVKIICPEHGIFEQTPLTHLRSYGCSKCTNKKKLTSKEFIEKAILVHGNKYNYSLVDYKNNRFKVKIICTIHGGFSQTPTNHLKGKGCPRCVGRYKTTEEFIAEAKLIHGDKFDYSLVKYKTSHSKINIICDKDGVFEQTPSAHLCGQSCPTCNESKGEREIKKFLEKNNINFIKQYRFKKCRDKKPLPFDFYLPKYNICIEYDGKQHFKPIKYFGGADALLNRQKKDKIKTIL